MLAWGSDFFFCFCDLCFVGCVCVCCGYFGAIWSDCCLDGATSGMDAFVWSLCCIGFLVFVGTFCDVYCILSWLVYESSQANSFGRWKLPTSRERDWKNTRNWSGQRDTLSQSKQTWINMVTVQTPSTWAVQPFMDVTSSGRTPHRTPLLSYFSLSAGLPRYIWLYAATGRDPPKVWTSHVSNNPPLRSDTEDS